MSVKIEGMEELNRNIQRYAKRFEGEASKAVNATAQGIRTTAIKSIRDISPGRAYASAGGHTHTASRPGDPPNRDTGYLDDHIMVENTGTTTATVTSEADYSADLEFGASDKAARPFMTPATEQERPEYRRRIQALHDKAARGV